MAPGQNRTRATLVEGERSLDYAIPTSHKSFIVLKSFIVSVVCYTVIVSLGNRVNASAIKDYATSEI